ncbi:MAG: substrate-binding domain-containing protein [Sphaerochaeta sp.]|jgi:LacI family transcriptional regulator|uniref:LacI family DNA-binding transcriptional regulator n=1 Tax=unclassified Sphaerochaeta TaxID=2637943 RepID=UPI000A968E18|nr:MULTISPECIES: LacI family DNA-binding transcriptional regulator [unclassified Sphaerochaeta]HPE92459.1 LacI family DNA-binding transcriptional regulator [Sphaerochaeta sp.]
MTISEIAKLAHVSIGTVDRVLHKRGRVAPETVKKVMSIVQDYGYQPNTYARNLKLSKDFTIGVLLPLLHSEFGYWSLIYEGILKAAKELHTLAVRIDMMEFDRMVPGSLLEKGKALLTHKVDALLLAPVVPADAQKLLSAKDIPFYAFIDSPLPNTNPVSCVVQNPFRGGFLAGRMMHLLTQKSGTLLTIQTHRAAYNSIERARGFTEYFANKPEFPVFEMEAPLTQNMDKELDAFYRKHGDVCGIFVVNDAIHRIAQSVLLLGRKSQTTMIGYDLIEHNRRAMIAGSVDCLISQRPEFQGYTAIYQLYRKGLLDQDPEETICVPIDIILPENLIDEKGWCPTL